MPLRKEGRGVLNQLKAPFNKRGGSFELLAFPRERRISASPEV
jgi:hypothetical protein